MNVISNLLVEIMHLHILDWNSHAFEILFIADTLEIPTAKEEIHFESMNLFQPQDCVVYSIKLSMRAALYCDMHFSNGIFLEKLTASLNIWTRMFPVNYSPYHCSQFNDSANN